MLSAQEQDKYIRINFTQETRNQGESTYLVTAENRSFKRNSFKRPTQRLRRGILGESSD